MSVKADWLPADKRSVSHAGDITISDNSFVYTRTRQVRGALVR